MGINISGGEWKLCGTVEREGLRGGIMSMMMRLLPPPSSGGMIMNLPCLA